MKLFLTTILSLLVLTFAGCDLKPTAKKGADGYYFEEESFVRTEFPVEIVLIQSQAEMRREIKKRQKLVEGKVESKDVAAFAIIRTNDPTCTIYMLDPKVKYEPEFIGHELVHCIYGVWHKEPQA
jgi:hypothetical protein